MDRNSSYSFATKSFEASRTLRHLSPCKLEVPLAIIYRWRKTCINKMNSLPLKLFISESYCKFITFLRLSYFHFTNFIQFIIRTNFLIKYNSFISFNTWMMLCSSLFCYLTCQRLNVLKLLLHLIKEVFKRNIFKYSFLWYKYLWWSLIP